MLRIFEDGAARPDFDDLPEIHHRYTVADALDHGHIVRNEQEGDPELLLQVEQEIDDLRPDRHVQRRNRLVGDHHLGIQGQRTGDGDPLALPAGEFVRIAVRHVGGQADLDQQLAHPRLRFGFRTQLMHQHRLHDRKADGQTRVERGKRVLKDKLDVTAQGLQRTPLQTGDITSGELDVTAVKFDQPRQRTPGGGFPAAGFANQRQGFPGVQHETEVFDRMHLPFYPAKEAITQGKARHQIAHCQHRRLIVAHRVGHGHGVRFAPRRQPLAVRIHQRETRRKIEAAHRAQARHGGQQGAGIRLQRTGEKTGTTALLDLFAAQHDQHTIRHFGDHAHVVRDEDHTHREFMLQLLDQRQDLCLDRHVQRRRRLVGDQQGGFAGQRHGNHRALTHAAGKLVRMPPQDIP